MRFQFSIFLLVCCLLFRRYINYRCHDGKSHLYCTHPVSHVIFWFMENQQRQLRLLRPVVELLQ